MKKIKCENCEKDITKRFKLTRSTLCVECKTKEGDDFKWKMKTVGFDEEPKIAKNKEDWEKLKKQTKVKDI